MKYAALLRGVNVGGKNKLPMKDLAAMFEEAGCTGVTTYIQSGNVVFSASPTVARAVSAKVPARIAERFGYRVPVIVCDASQLALIVAGNPYLREGIPESALYVAFLAGKPSDEAVKSLDPARSLPDAFQVRGQEIYLHLPNGVADSKLTNAWFDSKLATISSARNWATVLRLAAMTKS